MLRERVVRQHRAASILAALAARTPFVRLRRLALGGAAGRSHQVQAVEPTRRRSRPGGGLPDLLRHISLVNLKAAFKLQRHGSNLLAQIRHLLLDHRKLFVLLLSLQIDLAQLHAECHSHVLERPQRVDCRFHRRRLLHVARCWSRTHSLNRRPSLICHWDSPKVINSTLRLECVRHGRQILLRYGGRPVDN